MHIYQNVTPWYLNLNLAADQGFFFFLIKVKIKDQELILRKSAG